MIDGKLNIISLTEVIIKRNLKIRNNTLFPCFNYYCKMLSFYFLATKIESVYSETTCHRSRTCQESIKTKLYTNARFFFKPFLCSKYFLNI